MKRIIPFPGVAKPHQPRPLVPETPCEHRQEIAGGRVICRKVAQGDAGVSATLCDTCPAALVQCPHLQFTLRRHAPAPIVVRHPDGRTEAWDDLPPAMRFEGATCALYREAINTPADCAGCTLRGAVPAVEELRRRGSGRPAAGDGDGWSLAGAGQGRRARLADREVEK
jgi:hypothetical protein